ncbi:MAG: hypothetical protein JWO58_316 [Chitinophagaceae bacterium]|nr:hypothetical protein [Chitinophagaceae bacterium]
MKKAIAILGMKCPRCYEDNLYTYSRPLQLRQLHVMPDHCSCCGLSFTQEPGFYTGAMYVSYVLNILFFILFFFTFYIGLHVDGLIFMLTYSVSVLLLSPFLFRYSRTLYIHLFYSYEPRAKELYIKSMALKSQV